MLSFSSLCLSFSLLPLLFLLHLLFYIQLSLLPFLCSPCVLVLARCHYSSATCVSPLTLPSKYHLPLPFPTVSLPLLPSPLLSSPAPTFPFPALVPSSSLPLRSLLSLSLFSSYSHSLSLHFCLSFPIYSPSVLLSFFTHSSPPFLISLCHSLFSLSSLSLFRPSPAPPSSLSSAYSGLFHTRRPSLPCCTPISPVLTPLHTTPPSCATCHLCLLSSSSPLFTLHLPPLPP